MKTRVDVDKVLEALQTIRDFNKLNLREIELFNKGESLNIDDETIEDFRFTGLSNSCLIDETITIHTMTLSKEKVPSKEERLRLREEEWARLRPKASPGVQALHDGQLRLDKILLKMDKMDKDE